jgi:hypothetical protein
VDGENLVKYEGLRRKLEIFGSGRTRPDGLFGFGVYGRVVGSKAAAIRRAAAFDAVVAIDDADRFERVDPDDPFCSVCYLGGELRPAGRIAEPVHLAVSVNGVIRALTQSYREPATGALRFHAILPDDAFRDGGNAIEIFAVTSDEEGRARLSAIARER